MSENSDDRALKALVGCWTFDRARAEYGDEPLADSAIYSVIPIEGGLWCEVRWRIDGQQHVVSYTCVPDGERHPIEGADGVEFACRWQGSQLVTEVWSGDSLLQRASRRLVPATDERPAELVIVQEDPARQVRTVGYYPASRVKQVMLYRRDLKMRKGKIAAQCAHASMKVFFDRDQAGGSEMRLALPGPMAVWSRSSFAKVVLSVESEADLIGAWEAARKLGIPTALITDSGRTEFGGVPTRTTVALGPWTVDAIDEVSGPSGLIPTKLA